jgi:hypothetical protein
MVDRVIADEIVPSDRTGQPWIGLDEVPREEERRRHVRAAQRTKHSGGAVGVPAAVKRQRDDVLSRLQSNELACNDGRWRCDHHRSPGKRKPRARARRSGTGSATGRATTMTAP